LPTRGALVLAAPAEPGSSSLSPEDAARLGWILTEGTVRYEYVGQEYKGKTYRNGPYLRIHIDQSKPAYVSELRELVGVIASERITTPPPRTYPQGHTSVLRPSHRFELRSTEARSLFARAGLDEGGDVLTLLPQLSVAAREAMLDAMLKGDGNRHGNTWVFNQTGSHVMEIFQVLATLTGRALGRMQTAHAGIGNGPCLRQTLRVHRYIDLDALERHESTAQGAWCPTTAYGTWIMRLGGQVMITGNTRAKNRAVADLVGGGEVSAEEIDVTVVEQAALPPAANGRATDVPRPAESAAREPVGFNEEAATDAQLRAIRAHLRRTGIDEARACARAGVDRLDDLTRRVAAQLLGQLSKQPNAA
jgi:hypothetical protein